MSELSNETYELIQNKIQSVIQRLSEQQREGRLAKDISGAIENLAQLNNQIQAELEKLKASSEWKRFTIAFYGETNAGKSTLIEALRLQLGEKTKQESQRRFKEIQQRFGLTQEAFDEVRRVIMDTERAIEVVRQELAGLSKKYAVPIMQAELAVSQEEENAVQESAVLDLQHNKAISDLMLEISRLNELLEKVKAERKWWQKIIARFSTSPSPEEKQFAEITQHFSKTEKQQEIEKKELIDHHHGLIQQASTALAELQTQKQHEHNQVAEREQELQEALRKAEDERSRLDNEVLKLTEFADGQIIGDGRSDFTRVNTSFDFDLNGHSFSLIDVPGIEGDEAVVSAPIEEAVRKAHAVFYVTRTARPPQTNDDSPGSAQGTLEKIKKHLGAQSEVWSIYNHPARSPRQLTLPVLNNDIVNGLAAMDEKLKAELKEQYCGSLAISAHPAYLALTECVAPGSKDAADQRKFLDQFGGPEAILSLSGLTDFITRLQTTIISNYRDKIKRSNKNKAYETLRNSLDEFRAPQTHFSELEKNVKSEVLHAQSQINISLEEFIGSLDIVGGKIRRAFRDRVQKEIYDEIESNISNDEFKRSFNHTLELNAENIKNNLKKSIDKEADALGEKIRGIITRSSQHLKNIVTAQNNNFDLQSNFKININVDNGLKVGGLVAGGIGAALGVVFLASNPVGWTVAFVGGVLALLGSLVGIAKSVWGVFDSNYKKAQQKKEADKVLREADNTIEKEINKIIAKIKYEVSVEMKKIKHQLEEPVKQCIAINALFNQVDVELTAIARDIKY